MDATTKDLYTALHIAAKEGQEEVASVLLEHKASLTAATKKGFTPLHLAAKYGNLKVSRLLLEKDAPVDAEGNFPFSHCLKITQNVAFEFWQFPPIFFLLKLTCLVTLFVRKLQVFKNSSQ